MIFKKKGKKETKGKKTKDPSKKFTSLFKIDLNTMEFEGLSRIRKKTVVLLKWFVLIIRGFLDNQCMLRASALTYVTVLSIVPFLAVAFSIMKGFGFQKTNFIRDMLMKATGNVTMTDHIVNSIGNADVGALGAIGIGALLFTVISLLGNIEKSFNVIWGIKKGRTMGRKFTDYISVTLVAPIFMVVAMSTTAGLASQAFIQKLMSISVFAYVYLTVLKILPYFMVGLLFTFLYYFLPNATIKFKSAFWGGIIAGIMWQIAQWGFLRFGVAVARSTALYRNFAPLFIFFLWVYISWVIVLLGAEMSFAIQNVKTFQKEAGASKISNDEKQKLGVKMLILMTKNFESDSEPMTNEEISAKVNIPVRVVNEILFILEKYRIVIQMEKEGGQYFTLIKPPASIYVTDIVKYLNQYKVESIRMPADKEFKYIEELFDKMANAVSKSNANMNLKEVLAKVS